jgi:hypothetical protein
MHYLIIILALCAVGALIYYQKTKTDKKLKIDLGDVNLTPAQCKIVCKGDSKVCSSYENAEICSDNLQVCQNACDGDTMPQVRYIFNYNHIENKQKAMKNYLCDSNLLADLMMRKSPELALNVHASCYASAI